MEDNVTVLAEKSILQKVKKYLRINNIELTTNILRDNIQEMCVAKLCNVIGVNCKYNYKSEFFKFFSNIVGEAICRKLGIAITVAEDKFRLIKYERINLVDEALIILNNYDIDEAFIEMFEFLDKYKYILKKV